MAMRLLPRLCLLLCFLVGVARSSMSPVLRRLNASTAENFHIPPGVGHALSPPLISHDGRLVACSGKNLLAFEPNGSFAWIIHLGYNCKQDISLVSESDKIYLVAEDKVIKVTPQNLHTSAPTSEVFFSHSSAPGRSEEIIGLSTSSSYASLFITIMNRGLFSFSLRDGKLQWSVGPVADRFGYRLGCKANISVCYFNSSPVVDQCEGTLYISNTEGQLYSMYIHSRQYRWVQDLSSIDKVVTIAPGNNGRLYIVLPRKSIVMGLDVFSGNISWQQSVGPLSNEKILPAVDSNGWISIGSLDGILYSVSPNGDIRKFLQRTAPNSVIQSSPVLDCSGFSVYISQTIMEAKSSQTIGDYTYVSAMKPSSILFTLLAPATGTVYWTEKYPGELSNLLSRSDLYYFTLDETILTVLSAARIGNTVQCYTRSQKIAWTCRKAKPKFVHGDPGDHNHVLLLFFFQLIVIVVQAVIVRFCCIFWRKKKLQNNDLQKFLEKRRSLHSKRRVLGKIISELEQKAVEDASSNETLEQLGEMVKAKDGVERKLYTSYSLGRDALGLRQGSSILPLYYGKYKSHSFHGAQRESITVFNALSDNSTSEDRTSSSYSSGSYSSGSSFEEMELDTRSKSVEEAGPSEDIAKGTQDKLPVDVTSSYQVFMNPLYVQGETSSKSPSQREEFLVGTMRHDSAPTKRMWLKRRRTLSSTN